jgi:site-specific DNA-methyltransferase (adenine-specific)
MTPYYQDPAVTIYHGDCREILPTIERADLILTDPPYGHNNMNGDLAHAWAVQHGGNPEARPIANDGEDAFELVRFLFAQSARLLPPGGCMACCCGGGGLTEAKWTLELIEHLELVHTLTWDKGNGGMGIYYRRDYEKILIGKRPGKMKWHVASTDYISNVVRGTRRIHASSEDHPTPKPRALMGLFIRLHSEPGELVLDPFMGGGTTLRAAKDMGRKAIGIELDERFCEMSAKRMIQEVLL